MNLKSLVLLGGLAALLTGSLVSTVSAQEEWKKFHKDPANTGYIGDGNRPPGLSLRLAWTYPWPVRDEQDSYEVIVDDADVTSIPAGWTRVEYGVTPGAPENAYDDQHYETPVATPEGGTTRYFIWPLGANLPAGNYLVYAWFPSSRGTVENSDNVTYEVLNASDQVVGRVTISQNAGGRWAQLGNGNFRLGPNYKIRVSNFSSVFVQDGPPMPGDPGQGGGRYVDAGRFVMADAIRIVRDFGSIYSSPAVFKETGVGQLNSATVFGIVETDPFSRNANPEITWGRIVAVDSKFGPDSSFGTPDFNKPLWEYPRRENRDPNEGPIAGGVYSSPLVVDDSAGNPTVFVGADDRQVYALDARTGRLKWSGPGQTMDDSLASSVGFTVSDPGGDDYFGQGFRHAPVRSGARITYSFDNLATAGGKRILYRVYAWIPNQPDGLEWLSAARYTIRGQMTSTATVNQSSCVAGSEGPRWVQVGSAYLPNEDGELQVELTAETSLTRGCIPGATLSIVADAVRVIPESVDAFGYTSPTVTNVDGNATNIYVANSGGRIYSMRTVASDPLRNATTLNWIYPAVRSATDPLDVEPLGGFAGTPAIDGNSLYWGTVTGRVGRLDAINSNNPTLAWEGLTRDGEQLASIGGLTSSPLFDAGNVYLATSAGRVYKANASNGAVAWQYPQDWAGGGAPEPAGAFRYSSPSMARISGQKWVVVGSADSRLHVIPDAGPSVDYRRIQTTGDIFSSPATTPRLTIGGGNSFDEAAFFGTNSGILLGTEISDVSSPVIFGYRTRAQILHSSPAVAEEWVYIGGDDGRMYAFYSRNGGGNFGWPGNPGIGDPPGGDFDAGDSGGSEYFDLEVVTREDYDDPVRYFDRSNVLSTSGTVNRQPSGSPPNRLEWGETVYVIAWTVLNRGANVQFEFQNVGEGEQAGSLMNASQAANSEYQTTIPDPDNPGEFLTAYYCRYAFVLDPTKLMTPGDGYIIRGILNGKRTVEGQTVDVSLIATVPLAKNLGSLSDSRRNAPADQFVINNPLAISIPAIGYAGPGWTGAPGQSFVPNRNDSGAATNGTPGTDPVLVAPPAAHGANSIPQAVFLADRSSMGVTRPNSMQGLIRTLRSSRGDLGFPGNPINPMPWEVIPQPGRTNTSPDYPDISSRQVIMQKRLDGANPTVGNAALLPSVPQGTTQWRVTPDPLDIVVEVPRFQPPTRGDGNRYGTRMRVWIDANDRNTRAGVLDRADTNVTGRPLRGSEAYRSWNFALDVAPDYQMVAEDRTIDAGKLPPGFGLWNTTPNPFTPYPFQDSLTDLFKTFTIRNAGNVNLSNVRVFKNLQMLSDQVQGFDYNRNGIIEPWEGFTLSGVNILSSLDPEFDSSPDSYVFTNPVDGNDFEGHVISKPRVGDPGPTTLTIPDTRLADWLRAQGSTDVANPSLPRISVRVPIGTPAGTYRQVVPVFVDRAQGHQDIVGRDVSRFPIVSDPAFTLTATVREARLTDGMTTGSMTQLDEPNPGEPQSGDTQPAAFRAWSGAGGLPVQTGNLGVLWTSNRFGGADPNSPWSIYNSALAYDVNLPGFVPVAGQPRWWNQVTPAQAIPVSHGSNPASYFPGPPAGLPGSIVPGSVRFTSPSIATDRDTGQAWAAFVGEVVKNDSGNVFREYRIFYARMQNSGLMDTSSIQTVPTSDFTTPKFAPRIMSVQGNQLFVFWHASVGGAYRLFYNHNSNNGAAGAWSRDIQLTVPGAVTAAAEPSPVFRAIPRYEAGGSTGGVEPHIDLVYSAITSQSQNADLLLSRYRISTGGGGTASLSLQRMPRVYREELKRDTTAISLYTSQHPSWVRPRNGENPAASDTPPPDYELPIIRVLYFDPSTGAYAPNYLWVNNSQAQVDESTGLVLYNVTGMPYAPLNGRMAVDTSAGTVRFERALPGRTRVEVDYTPQTWRLTGTPQAETSPFALLDNSSIGRPEDPFVRPQGSVMQTGRKWLFWREGTGAVQGNTIFYETRRLGIQLSRPIAINTSGQPVQLQVFDGTTPYAGTYELDWAGNRIFFPESMEGRRMWVRYLSSDGVSYDEPAGFTSLRFQPLTWIVESPKTAVQVDSMVNEGHVAAFLDPDSMRVPQDPRYKPSLVWVFWTSSRAGSTDVYYQTLAPALRARVQSAN